MKDKKNKHIIVNIVLKWTAAFIGLCVVVWCRLLWFGPLSLAILSPFLRPFLQKYHIQSFDSFLCLDHKKRFVLMAKNIIAVDHKIKIKTATIPLSLPSLKWGQLTIDNVHAFLPFHHSGNISDKSIKDILRSLPTIIPIPLAMHNVHIHLPEKWHIRLPAMNIFAHPYRVDFFRANTIKKHSQTLYQTQALASIVLLKKPQISCVRCTFHKLPLTGTVIAESHHKTHQWSIHMDGLYKGHLAPLHQWLHLKKDTDKPQASCQIQGQFNSTSGLSLQANIAHPDIQIHSRTKGSWHGQHLVWQTKINFDKASIPLSFLPHAWQDKGPARKWVVSHITNGCLKSGSFTAQGKWHHKCHSIDSLDTVFKIHHVDILAMESLSPIKNIDMTLMWKRQNEKNIIKFDLASGHLGQQSVQGSVHIQPKLFNHALHNVIDIDLKMHGPFSDLIQQIKNVQPFKLDIEKSTDASTTKLHCDFPLLSAKVIKKAMNLSLESVCTKESLIFGEKKQKFDLKNLSIKASLIKNQLNVSGMNRLYDQPISWHWARNILSWDGLIHPDFIRKLPFDCHASTAVPIRGTYDGRYFNVVSQCHDVDLKCPIIDWHKPAGHPLSMHLQHCALTNKTSIQLKGKDANGSGHIHRLSSGFINTCHIQCRLGANIGLYSYTKSTPSAHARHMIFARIPLIKLSKSILPRFDHQSKDIVKKDLSYQKTECNVHIDMKCDRCHIDSQEIQDVTIQLSGQGKNKADTLLGFDKMLWTKGQAHAYCTNLKKKKDLGLLCINLDPSADHPHGVDIQAHSYRFFPVWQSMGLKNFKTQTISLFATQTKEKGVFGTLNMGLYWTKMPLLGRLISVVSPSLFAQNFSRKGIRFDTTRIDFAYDNDQINILKLLSEGYSLGILCKGSIDLKNRMMNLNGVIIPEYMINTAFKHIPIMGWILGGSKGLVSSQFAFTGSIHQPTIKIFPLSLFKLGFLKKIFS